MTNDTATAPSLSPTLRAFMGSWQPRQRRTLGMLNALLTRLQAVANAHPEWADYDLLTHVLAALHLIIENDRLTGGRTEDQIVDELIGLVALEHPEDSPAKHRAIAESVVDVLTNARNRRLRLRDRYVHAPNALASPVERREQSFSFVRAVGDEESAEPTLRATPEAVNVFQNLYQFDPSDRAAAERYRSERMLDRAEYDEVLTSVGRRTTSVHGLRGELEGLVRRINYNVRDVDYAAEVIPRLDEVISVVAEQVNAEETFAEAVADLAHHDAPDLPRLQGIADGLRALIGALGQLQSVALATRHAFEEEQDRQLFTYRRITINPQAELLEPLLRAMPGDVVTTLAGPLAVWLGPRAPRVMHFGELVVRSTPGERVNGNGDDTDPFDLGDHRGDDELLTPALIAAVSEVLAGIQRPTTLSALLSVAAERVNDAPDVADRLPWALAVTVANAYGHVGLASDQPGVTAGFDHNNLTVVATGDALPPGGPIAGDDLVVVPRRAPERKRA